MPNLHELISQERIALRIREMARELSTEYHDKDPVFLVVMNGAFLFAADLLREFNAPCTMAFIQIKSYSGTTRYVLDANENQLPDLAGKHVVILEDIVDSGHTLHWLLKKIQELKPAGIKSVALINKKVPHAAEADMYGFDVDDVFIVGYGLDVDGRYRNLPSVCRISGV